MKTLSILVPAYNEAKTIIEVLTELKNLKLDFEVNTEILVIDDYSSDNTVKLVQAFIHENNNLDITLLQQDINRGKGAALHKGIVNCKGDFIIVQDADLEYDPGEFNILLKPVIQGKADVVYGSRFMGGNAHRILFFWHTIGNKFLTLLSNAFTNLNLTDMETCYKLFNANILKSLDLKEKRFGFEPEVTAKMSRWPDIRIYEVGISYYGRTYKEGKKINWKDGFRALWCVLKYNTFSK
ncbi:glycosyltransferase family 2 protein [Zunongwangia sp. SCSIO 43204]|uniref:glycosyltransferase family 2 protein n=1 Tax=Zunongwangia sp. SCSIO 43204 TaxID=2779359 RepID=UPI001CA97FF5|nr:glycosyltransferase family 2 protein [Zunongwangia sp. SCSIO 43204]UAB86154.1 glycosyltransferase family 2 protein [Zunongwangia sp. SCSIO 43204]